MNNPSPVTIELIRAAHERIRPFIHRTPVLTSGRVNALASAQLFFKCENFQKVGAFKARGAHNAILGLSDEEAARGVVTHSSGNHAGAVALAARARGAHATIIMPSNAPRIKKAAVLEYGGKIIECEPTVPARESTTAAFMAQTGAVLIHPYDDDRIVAGQGTAAVEFIEQVPDLDYLLTPVGGGGLLSGSAIAARALDPRIKVVGTEPALADDAWRSFKSGQHVLLKSTTTIADGLRISLGERNFAYIRANVHDIVTVTEDGIIAAMRLVWESMKIIIEPSCAVPLAALLENQVPAAAGRRVGIILTGGNVDLDSLPWMKK